MECNSCAIGWPSSLQVSNIVLAGLAFQRLMPQTFSVCGPWAVDWSCADLLDFGFVMNGGEGRAERGQGPLRGSWAGRDRDRVSWQRRGPWQAGVVFPKEHGDFLSTPSDLRGEDLKGTQPERRLGENDRLRLSGRRLSSTI